MFWPAGDQGGWPGFRKSPRIHPNCVSNPQIFCQIHNIFPNASNHGSCGWQLLGPILLCILSLSFLLTGALLFQPKVSRGYLVSWVRANWRPWLKSTKKTLTFMLTTHTVFSIEFDSSIVWQMSGAFALDLVIAWIVKTPLCHHVSVYIRKIYWIWSNYHISR